MGYNVQMKVQPQIRAEEPSRLQSMGSERVRHDLVYVNTHTRAATVSPKK